MADRPVAFPRSYQDDNYFFGFLEFVGGFQLSGILQDVVLEVEGRRFPCHRLVLSAASPYFRAMFTSDMAESRQKTVVLQGLDTDIFGEVLSYIYSGTLHVSIDKVQPLYQAADLLQLDYVRDTCSSYMVMNVECSNCLDLYKFADVFSIEIVLKRCLQWIARYFAEFFFSEEFCSLSVNNLMEIISNEELDVKEESTMWEAVVRWVQHSREDRLHHLPSILPHIRFNLLTSDDMAAILDDPLVRDEPWSSEVIRNVVQEKMTTEMVLLDCLDNKSSKEFLFMNPRKGHYIRCSYKPEDCPFAVKVTVTSDNNIYILTHDRDRNEHLPIYKYNHAENVWEHAGMSSVYRWHSWKHDFRRWGEYLVEVDQILYYLGVDEVDESGSVWMWKYNRNTDQWEECSKLQHENTTYWHCATLSCGSHLYFLTSAEVHFYDTSQDRWCKRTPPMTVEDVSTAVAMGTEIFCTDRYFTQTLVYDTESDCWQKLQGWPNPENREIYVNPRLFVMENQLHVWFTCLNDGENEHLVYVYDRSADTWTDLKVTLPLTYLSETYIARGSHCPVARMYLPYLKGE